MLPMNDSRPDTRMTPLALHGRAHELDRLTDLLDGLQARGAAVAVVGEPGIGKSALLEAVARHATESGMLVLRTTGVRSEANLPFAGLGQLLQPVLAAAERLPGFQRDAVLGAVGQIDAEVGDFLSVALGTLSLLRDRSADAPVLVMADDTQWLDAETLDVLAFVARRIELDPLLVLVSSRTTLRAGLTEAPLEHVELTRLDEASARSLVAAHAPHLDPELCRRLLQEAAGNPLALVELALMWSRLPPTSLLTSSVVPVTTKIERAFAERLRQLPALTRTLLLVAALDDGDLLADVLTAASLTAGAATGPAELSAAIEARLIEVDGAHLKFRHPLVRSVIYQAASLSERHAAHGGLAEVLDERRAIWHRSAAALLPDEPIAAGLERAGREALRRGTIAVAITAFERSAELSPEPAERGRRALEAAELALKADRQDVAGRLVAQATSLSLTPLDRARAQWIVQQVEGALFADVAEMTSAIATIEKISAAGGTDRAMDALGSICDAVSNRFSEQHRSLMVAATERLPVGEHDPRPLYIRALNTPLEYNEVLLTRIHEVAQTSGVDPEHLWRLSAAAGYRGDPQLALTLARQAIAGLRAQGRLAALKAALTSAAAHAWTAGDWDLAADYAGEASRLAQQADQPADMIATMLLTLVGAGRGDSAPAEQLGRDMEQWGRQQGLWPVVLVGLSLRGWRPSSRRDTSRPTATTGPG